MISSAAVAAAAEAVRERISRAGGGPGVRIVAVTKGFGPDAVEAAVTAGLADIGENYAQEAVAKLAAVRGERPRVHFIGHLQTNKVRLLAPVVDLWQTVDRAAVAAEVARRAPGAAVLVQVNVSAESTKGGCEPAEAKALVAQCRAGGLDVQGLMAIGRTGAPADARPGFRMLRRLADDLGLAEVSMGMTDDLEVAVEEGATMVRVGTALFGARPVATGPRQ